MRAAAKILGRTIPILRSNAPLRVLSTKTSARRKSKDNGVDTDAAKKVSWKHFVLHCYKFLGYTTLVNC